MPRKNEINLIIMHKIFHNNNKQVVRMNIVNKSEKINIKALLSKFKVSIDF